MYRIPWLLAAALVLAIAGCNGDGDDGGEPPPAIDAGQPAADAAPAADGGAGPVDAAPAIDAGADALGPDLDGDACQHMSDGPSQAVAPAASREIDAEDVTPAHVRWESALLSGASGYQYGFLDLVVEEAGRISVYEDEEELSMALRAADGTEVIAESTEAAACTRTMERHTFDLAAGTYELELGSFYVPTARLVVLRADDPGH